MDQLSSCYFCGDALDASLSEYPVVPKQLHPDPADQGTVVLCQSCRQKLAPIVERVVESARDAADVPDARAADGSPAGADESDPSRSTESAGVDGGTIDVGDDVRGSNDADASASSAADRSDAAGWGSPDAGDADGAADETSAAAPDAGATTGSRREESAEPESASDDDGGRAYTSSQAAGGRPVNGDGSVGSGSEARTASGGGEGDSGANAGASSVGEEGTAPGANGAGDGAADADDAAANDDAGPPMSALEYNKVIRLLQNRELPVDRAEFQTVALNAYDLEKEEFDAILDAAVQRGLIAEENGQIVSAK